MRNGRNLRVLSALALGLCWLLGMTGFLAGGADAQVAVPVVSSTTQITHTDGTSLATLLGSPADMRLLPHFAAKAAVIAGGGTAQITYMAFGDSVAGKKSLTFVPNLQRAYGVAGWAFDATTNAITGDVNVNDGTVNAFDYTYWPTGSTFDVGTGSVLFQVGGGAPVCNTAKAYYALAPGKGPLKVDLLDASGNLLATQTLATANASIAGGVAGYYVSQITVGGSPTGGTYTLTYRANAADAGQTTGAIAYNATASAIQTALQALPNAPASGVTVTTNGGYTVAAVVSGTNGAANPASLTANGAGLTGGTSPSVTVSPYACQLRCSAPSASGASGRAVVVSAAFINTAVSGLVQMPLSRGGLYLGDAIKSSQSVLTAVIGDLAPDFATYEAKEDLASYSSPPYGTLNYPQRLDTHVARFRAACATTDWIYILTTPILPDYQGTGTTVAENAIVTSEAQKYGYAVFDGYTPIVSINPANSSPLGANSPYANLVAMGWQGDGTHVSALCDRYLGSLMLKKFGLLDFEGAKQSRDTNAANVTVQGTLTVGPATNPVPALQMSSASGYDTVVSIDRSLQFQGRDGTPVANFQARSGNSYLPGLFFLGSTGARFYNGNSANNVTITSNTNTDTVTLSVKAINLSGDINLPAGSVIAAGKLRTSQGLAAPMTSPSTTTATPATVTKWMQVYDSSGNAVGFVPVYAITP